MLVGDVAPTEPGIARAVLVKDERHYDRYDRVFAAHFRGAQGALEALVAELTPNPGSVRVGIAQPRH